MRSQVIKGVDDEIEFKGFKGRYFYQLVGVVIGVLLLTFLLYGIGFTSIWLFLFMLMLGSVGFFYIRSEQEKNKKFGHIYKTHNAPVSIVQNKQFYRFIK